MDPRFPMTNDAFANPIYCQPRTNATDERKMIGKSSDEADGKQENTTAVGRNEPKISKKSSVAIDSLTSYQEGLQGVCIPMHEARPVWRRVGGNRRNEAQGCQL